MGFSSRRAMMGIIYALIGLVIIEILVLCSLIVVVPDLPQRIQRFNAIPQADAPPARQQSANTNDIARPLKITDSFETPSPRWDQSYVAVSNNQLQTELFLPQSEVYTLWTGLADDPTIGSRVSDFDLQVDVTQTRGGDDAAYGMRFRQNTTDSYIMAAINSRGYWRIIRASFGEISDMTPWQFSHHIATGLNATNQLRVVASGTQISFYVNGIRLTTISDLSPASGQLTLAATTFTTGDLAVNFDNVRGSTAGKSFQDQFDSPTTAIFSQGGSYSRDGKYHIISSENVSVWQNPLPRAKTEVQDFHMKVDGTIVAGDPDQIAYGVLFGDKGDFGHTMVIFNGAGQIQIVRNSNDGNDQAYIDPVIIKAFRTGAGVTNTIDMNVRQGELSLKINDIDVGSIDIGESPIGSVGMIVICAKTAAQVDFDNLTITEQTP
jgi:hypothetical protein